MLHLAVEMHLLLYAAGSTCADELYVLTQSYDLTITSLTLYMSMTEEHVLLLEQLFIKILWKGREAECLFGILMQDDALKTVSVRLNWLIYTTVKLQHIHLPTLSCLCQNYDMTTITPSHHKHYFLLESAFSMLRDLIQKSKSLPVTYTKKQLLLLFQYSSLFTRMRTFTVITWYSLGYIFLILFSYDFYCRLLHISRTAVNIWGII